MTHEEEELQHDISKLQEKVHQISLTQRATKNEMDVLKKGMEANMDGLKGVEAKMDGMEEKMEGLQEDMEGLKEGLTKLLQKMIPNSKKLVEETHDENKINVNRDFINSNVGWKNHHIPKMDMRKFDGKDLVTWILQMEQYFDLNNVQNTQKVRTATINLEQSTFLWYR